MMISKKKRIRTLIGGAAILLFLYLCFGGEYNIYKFLKLKQKHKELFSEVKDFELEKKELSEQIEKLNTDLAYIEKIAREEYKMGKQGEKIYIIKEKDNK
ncbi:MAG: septum formation initiator family protein [bacterium]